MKAKDEALNNLISVINKEGFSILRMDTSLENTVPFQVEKTKDGLSKAGQISLVIKAD